VLLARDHLRPGAGQRAEQRAAQASGNEAADSFLLMLENQAAAEAAIGSVKTRLWLAYLAGCSLAFQRNTVGIFQTLASKRLKGPAELPPTRADLYADWA
jgi:hypothetical protein